MVPAEVARRLADRYFGSLATPLVKRVRIPGNSSDVQAERDEMERQRRELANAELPKSERRARSAELDAWEDRLDETVIIPDREEVSATGETFGQIWNSAGDAERARYLRRWTGRIEFGPADGTELCTADGTGLWVDILAGGLADDELSDDEMAVA
jgi:hypothetical protein